MNRRLPVQRFTLPAIPIRFAAAALGLLALLVQPAQAGDAKAAFFAGLGKLCGATYEGASVFPQDPADAFAGKKLVATITSCKADEIRIPFVVGADRSRTWIIRHDKDGLTLKHDHRHEDGTPDKQTMYGGLATTAGTAQSQSFAADAYTAALIPAAVTNVWTITLSPDAGKLTYYLERDGKPRFKAELYRMQAPRR